MLWVSRVVKLVGLTCLLERGRIPPRVSEKNAASVSLVFGPVLCGVCQRDVVRLHALPPDQAHAATASCVDVSPVHSLQQQVMCMVCRTVRGSSQENPSVLGPKWPIREGGVICWQPCCVCMSAEKSEQ